MVSLLLCGKTFKLMAEIEFFSDAVFVLIRNSAHRCKSKSFPRFIEFKAVERWGAGSISSAVYD